MTEPRMTQVKDVDNRQRADNKKVTLDIGQFCKLQKKKVLQVVKNTKIDPFPPSPPPPPIPSRALPPPPLTCNISGARQSGWWRME